MLRVTEPALPLIEHVGGIANYCKCITAWSIIVMNAHRSQYSEYLNQKYKAMTVKYYILRMSEWKTTRPYTYHVRKKGKA